MTNVVDPTDTVAGDSHQVLPKKQHQERAR